MSMNEENTKLKLITPKLRDSGWRDHDWQIDMEYALTAGRIQWDGKQGKRAKPTYADYLLRYSPSLALAIVEAKAEGEHYMEGEKQAKDYAQKLGLWFAYATNGHEIEFYDLKADTREMVSRFHTPEELWNMYLSHTGLKNIPENVLALTHDYYDESQIGQRRKPRYYQEKAVNGAIQAILNEQKRVLITQATGTGKTFTSMQLVYKLWKSKAVKKILFIVDRNLLADQAFIDFNNAMDKDACYRITPNREIPKSRDLYFGIYQSLVGINDEGESEGRPDRYKEFDPDFFDLIVIDEAHRGGANEEGSWFRLLEYFESAIHVGLTATPRRGETNNTYNHFGLPIINYSLKDGIKDGYLSPYIIKRVTSNIDALGYRPEHGDVRDVRGQLIENRDYLSPDFERELSIPERTRAFAYHLLRHLFSTDPLGKTIVFCVNQEHAADMAKFVQEAFKKYKDKYQFDYNGDYAVRITGNDREANGKYPMLEKFSDLESYEPIVVTTSKLLTTGIDVKTVKNVVIFRNIGSMVEFKQIIGRGTRIYDHPDRDRQKLGFYILEYANHSTQLFNDPEWDDEPEIIVNEGSLDVEAEDGGTAEDAVPVAEQEEQPVDSQGILIEPEEDERRIRYRMSEDFLRGAIDMAAESELFIGEDGQPLPKDQFIIYQSDKFKKHYPEPAALSKMWLDNNFRKKFVNEEATDIGINVSALQHLFFEKHSLREVDLFDVLLNIIYGQKFLTKEERIQESRKVRPDFYSQYTGEAAAVVDDLLQVYQDMEFQPFAVTAELWQTTQMRKHGTIAQIQQKVGGPERLKNLINGLQDSLYDMRISA